MSVKGIRVVSSLVLAMMISVSLQLHANGQALTSAKGRKLAPDAMVLIKPAAEWGETAQGPVDLPLVVKNPGLAWQPKYDSTSRTLLEKSKQIVFRGDVYCLEFAFKPVRMIEVNLPTATGMQTKNVWYLLYRVRYLGGDLKPVPEPDAFNNEVYAQPKQVSAEWVRLMPTFRLSSLGLNLEYLDKVIPEAKREIAAKERVGQKIYDSLEIQQKKIQLSGPTGDFPLWGVATWTDVDSRTDFFSVQVQGLTNAQQLELDGDKIKYLQKTLVLHFSRPGDTIDEIEDTIRYGIPALADPKRQKYILDQYGQEERLDHVWIYR